MVAVQGRALCGALAMGLSRSGASLSPLAFELGSSQAPLLQHPASLRLV